MESAKAYVYISVRENQGKIKRLKDPHQAFEVMWNQVQIFKIKGEKIEEIWYKKGFTTFQASSLPTKPITFCRFAETGQTVNPPPPQKKKITS